MDSWHNEADLCNNTGLCFSILRQILVKEIGWTKVRNLSPVHGRGERCSWSKLRIAVASFGEKPKFSMGRTIPKTQKDFMQGGKKIKPVLKSWDGGKFWLWWSFQVPIPGTNSQYLLLDSDLRTCHLHWARGRGSFGGCEKLTFRRTRTEIWGSVLRQRVPRRGRHVFSTAFCTHNAQTRKISIMGHFMIVGYESLFLHSISQENRPRSWSFFRFSFRRNLGQNCLFLKLARKFLRKLRFWILSVLANFDQN